MPSTPSPEASSSPNADVAGDNFDADFLATSATQPNASSPSATSTVSVNQASSATSPMTAAIGLENIELSNDEPGSPTILALKSPLEIIDDDEISNPSILLSAGTCNKLKLNDNRLHGYVDRDHNIQVKQAMISREDSTIVPTQVDESDHEVRLISSGVTGEEETDHEMMRIHTENSSSTPNPMENNDADILSSPEIAGNVALETNAIIVHEPQELIIYDAFLVELSDDDDVIIATHLEPTLPWWKVRRIQLVLSALLLFAAVNVITVILLNQRTGNKTPSNMTAPTPSSAELSSSNHSSLSSNITTPKICADKVTSNAHTISNGLDDPHHPRIAVDGGNMVIAVRDGDSTSSQVVIFYSLMNNGTWLEVSSFRMDNVGSADASVDISGQTALVGFGDANNFVGVVIVFDQNQDGGWEQVNDSFIRTTVDNSRYGFGLHHIAIDGNVACVIDYNDCVLGVGISSCNHNVNIFRRVGETWVELDVIAGNYCRISGDILAVLSFATFSDGTRNLELYELNADTDGFLPYQDPIIVYDDVLSMELSPNYFVYWDRFQQGAVVYRRQNESAPYSFVDQIFVNAPLENQIALENDVLIVGGDNQTHVFTESNGIWAEAMILEQGYVHYALSGRSLLATSAMSVYSFNIEECTQEMPAQSPSLSMVPSSSFSPSLESLSSSTQSVIPPMQVSSPFSSSWNVGSSIAPSACVDKMISNSQIIETFLEDSRFFTMEIDGRTMVLVAEDENGLDYVMFFELAINGEWEIDEVFNLGDFSVGTDVAATISGNAAFVGFPYAYDKVGSVVVFHRNQAGKWEKVNDPFTIYSAAPNWKFGYGIEIDGNLAIVATDNWEDNKILVFRRENNKWVQFDIFNGRCPCSIAGNVIVSLKMDALYNQVVQLYKYKADTGTFVPLQDPIPTGQVYQLDSSQDFFIYWDAAASWFDGPTSVEKTSNTFMYRRENGNQTFTFSRQFNITGVNDALSIDNDLLVIAGRVFSLQNGKWVETFTLERRFDEFKLSGRFLLARTSDVVVSFSMDDCTQEMPTQVPSLSPSPSAAASESTSITRPSASVVPTLSSAPSGYPLPSLAPNLSSAPTDSCYEIMISINYDDFSSEVSWKLFRKDTAGEQLLHSYATTNKIPLHNDLICLPEGTYEFIIYDSAHDGICCKYDVSAFYSLSLDNGVLIRKGGEFGYSESTLFSIPFVPLS